MSKNGIALNIGGAGATSVSLYVYACNIHLHCYNGSFLSTGHFRSKREFKKTVVSALIKIINNELMQYSSDKIVKLWDDVLKEFQEICPNSLHVYFSSIGH